MPTAREPGAEREASAPLRASAARAYVRVVRPGGSGGGAVPGGGAIPPMPVAPPSALPPWLTADDTHPDSPPADAHPADGRRPDSGTDSGPASGSPAGRQPDSGQPGSGRPASGRPAEGYPADSRPADATQNAVVLSPGESELRDLLHRSVSGLEPAAGSLDALRRAVPQRRARRRRYSGAATALVLGVLGGLALHSLAGVGSLTEGSQAGPGYQNAATASTAPSGGASPSADAPTTYPQQPDGAGAGWATASRSGAAEPSGAVSGSRSGSAVPWVSPSGLPDAGTVGAGAAAECTRAQLGAGAATVGAPGADGTVYGSFQVANVSQSTCQVSLPGTVSVLAVSGTTANRIAVVQHSAADPATQLPTPAATPGPVLLAPGQAYVVDFAWVPATGAEASACADDSAPSSPTTESSAPSGTSAGAAGSAPPGEGTAPTISPPSTGEPTVTIAHTPGAGDPLAASAVLPGACSGTVYDTLPLAAG
ncbi:hypothetical protein [Streptacidiphilus sp. P02-A3a]|uniref:hypothetical protein n=1 Tax=Streptacidiphilus sp. P02-A3a TaxID=2704468 RepID=UPI0015FE3EE9|nr:hypothetical protein [Streptacidiphilus sp. P02-A3a]QMU67139.1 hypothetical protein GXP74_01830 [Streptacidiphilus sp. P02-A3a]